MPPLDPTDRSASRVWRVEIRAGKDLLKDRWQIRLWAGFDAQFGDVVAEALQRIRYCTADPQDTNRARWPNHPLWDLISAETGDDLTEMRSHLPPNQIKHVHRAEHIRLIMAQLAGNAITLAALEGTSEAKLTDHMVGMGGRLRDAIMADPTRAANKLDQAKDRYRLLSER